MATTYNFTGNLAAVRPGALQVGYIHFTVVVGGTVQFAVANGGTGGEGDDASFLLFTADSAGRIAALVSGSAVPGSELVTLTLAPGTYILAFSESTLFESEARLGANVDDDAAPVPYSVTITAQTATLAGVAAAYSGRDTPESVINMDFPAIWGLGGNDSLDGAVGTAQLLLGGFGDDTLTARDALDTLEGGPGDDIYILYTEGSTIVEAADAGRDQVITTSLVFSLETLPNVEDLVGLDYDPFLQQPVPGQTLIGNDAANLIIGREFDDELYGLTGNDTLNGQGGADTIDGGAGDDIAFGGAGDDRLLVSGLGNDNAGGGGGTDTLVIDYGAASLSIVTRDSLNGIAPPTENQAGGYDGRYTDLVGRSTTFTEIERFDITTGSGGDFIWTGNGADRVATGAGDDVLITFGGDDVLDGGTGADLMRGGAGDDVYHVDAAGDTVEEVAAEGTDEVRTALGSRSDFTTLYVLPAFVDNLTGTALAGQGVSGNSLDNLIRTDAGADLVVLQDGGDDQVESGDGDDFLYYGAAFTSGDRNDGGDGFDTLGLLGTYTLVLDGDDLANIEKLALYGSGGAGTNNYTIATSDATVAAGAGLFVAAGSLAATETLLFDGSAETNGRFSILSGAGADTIVGGAKNDFVFAGAGDDLLFGLGGNDTLRGGLGADTLRGGAGRDTFRYEATAESTAAATDRILDFEAGGVDRIDLSAIDAKAGTPEDDAFTFIGTGTAFSGAAGELRVVSSGTDWFVEADTDGNMVADLAIRIDNGASILFAAGDFVL